MREGRGLLVMKPIMTGEKVGRVWGHMLVEVNIEGGVGVEEKE